MFDENDRAIDIETSIDSKRDVENRGSHPNSRKPKERQQGVCP